MTTTYQACINCNNYSSTDYHRGEPFCGSACHAIVRAVRYARGVRLLGKEGFDGVAAMTALKFAEAIMLSAPSARVSCESCGHEGDCRLRDLAFICRRCHLTLLVDGGYTAVERKRLKELQGRALADAPRVGDRHVSECVGGRA